MARTIAFYRLSQLWIDLISNRHMRLSKLNYFPEEFHALSPKMELPLTLKEHPTKAEQIMVIFDLSTRCIS